MVKIQISSDNAPAAAGPYSQGIFAANIIFVSGQIPLDKTTGKIVEGGIASQTKKALENLSAVLKASDSSLDGVVKTTVFLKDMKDFAEMNRVYGEFFKAPYPARSCVSVSELPKNSLIEIEAMAVKNA